MLRTGQQPVSLLSSTYGGDLVSLAVIARRSGPQRTNTNLNGPLRTTPRGFEDRGLCIHSRPSASIGPRTPARQFHDHPPSSAVVHQFGCHLGCH